MVVLAGLVVVPVGLVVVPAGLVVVPVGLVVVQVVTVGSWPSSCLSRPSGCSSWPSSCSSWPSSCSSRPSIFIQKIESCDAVPLKNRIKKLVVLSLREDGHGKFFNFCAWLLDIHTVTLCISEIRGSGK